MEEAILWNSHEDFVTDQQEVVPELCRIDAGYQGVVAHQRLQREKPAFQAAGFHVDKLNRVRD